MLADHALSVANTGECALCAVVDERCAVCAVGAGSDALCAVSTGRCAPHVGSCKGRASCTACVGGYDLCAGDMWKVPEAADGNDPKESSLYLQRE